MPPENGVLLLVKARTQINLHTTTYRVKQICSFLKKKNQTKKANIRMKHNTK